VTMREVALSSLHQLDQHQIMATESHISYTSPPPTAAQFAEVKVHTGTGEVEVERLLMVVDCGRVINPITAAGQVEGGMAQALGFTMGEDTYYNEAGKVTNDRLSTYEMVKKRLSQFKVIRATSPLDGKTLWVEIFQHNVSKGNAAAWLCSRIGCTSDSVLGIGNDYNDIDLLQWTGHSIVVANAPEELKSQFEVTDSNINNGVTKAIVKIWGDAIH